MQPVNHVTLSQTLNDSEPEDVLHAVDPNEVFPSGPPADPSSESDSGISEDPVVESPVTMVTANQPAPATVYQVVYDISGLGGVKTEPGHENVISIELGEDESQSLNESIVKIRRVSLRHQLYFEKPQSDASENV